MTTKRLAEIDEREKAATKGPWKAVHRNSGCTAADDEDGGLGLEIEGPPEPMRGQFSRSADAQFTSHARADIPDLVEHVRELREIIRRRLDHWAHNTTKNGGRIVDENARHQPRDKADARRIVELLEAK